MTHGYGTYTEISAHALSFNPRSQEVIAKKQEIVTAIAQHHGKTPASVLFYGFSPLMLGSNCKSIFVTGISDEIKKFIDTTAIKYTYISEDDLHHHVKKFDWVVATDEYFTFAATEEQQRASIEFISSLAKDVIVTTLRDYKNQDFREREFSQPLAVRNGRNSKLFLEYHDYDYSDKNSWNTSVYEMTGADVQQFGPFARRSMFFKQMAKFSIDAGAKEFYIHKNLMYKSLIKKNYEHVISITF